MMRKSSLNRRRLLGVIGTGSLGALGAAALAGCGETQIVEVVKEVPVEVEKIVTKEVEVERVVTKIVEKVVTAAPAAKAKQVTGEIEYWDWWNPAAGVESKNWFEWVKADFEAQNPGIKIKMQFVPFGNEYVQKLSASSAAGDPPDILHSSIIWARDFYDLGITEELNSYIKTTPEMGMEHFLEGALFYNSKKGKIFGIPMEGPDSYVLYYDRDMLLEAGIDPSFDSVWNWNWDDFRENANKLTTRKPDGSVDRSGFLVYIPHGGAFSVWQHTQNGFFYNENQDGLQITDGTAKGWIEYTLALLNEDKVSLPLGPERQDFQQFLQGKSAFVNGGTWGIARVRNGAPDKNFDLVPYPEGPMRAGDGPATTTWYNMVVIPKKGKQKDAAWEWAKYYAGLQSFKDRIRIMSRFAPRKALYTSDEWSSEIKREPMLTRVPRIAPTGGYYPFIRYNEVNNILRPKIESIYLEGADIDQTLEEIEAEVNPILAAAGGA